MSTNPGLAHSVPPLQNSTKGCTRCGKEFHLFRSRNNCYNCGSAVCENCSNFRAKLPQFGYEQPVRCCTYCAHFLKVSKMDYAALLALNIKTLRGYLLSYNIPTQGMLEKQELIHAIQSYKPIPEASEVYFREHLPSRLSSTPEKSSSLLDHLTGLGRSQSPSGSSQGSSGSSSGGGDSWMGDIDKFFSGLFGGEDRQSTPVGQTRQSQSQSQPRQTQSRQQPQSHPQPQRPWQQPQSWPSGTAYTPPSQSPRPRNPGTTNASASYRPQAGNPPNPPYTQSRPSPSSFSPRPSSQTTQFTRPPTTSNSASTTSSSRVQTTTAPTLTLEQVMTSKTEPSTLSIKALKGLLDHSCVTYVGVVEKRDLEDRLQKLIDNTKAEQSMLQEQEAAAVAEAKKAKEASKGPSSGGANEDENLCKICCDAALNCVMLNCNHMSTCMDCGKLILEGSRMCPICREYIVRLLHVFRS